MSRARATALVLSAVFACAAGCGESDAPGPSAGGAGRDVHPSAGKGDGGETGVSRAGSGESGAGEAGEGGVANGARPSSGGSGGRRANTMPGAHGGKGGRATTGSGGTTAVDAGSGGAGKGGASEGGTSGAGATSGSGGAQGGNAALAGSDGLGAAGAGGQSNQLSICLRLSGKTALDIEVTNDFQNTFVVDCRINWTYYLYENPATGLDEQSTFANHLLAFNYALWGCLDSPPPTRFELIYEDEPLTLADAGALIDAYMSVAGPDLSLSTPEAEAMRAALERLSQPLLVSPDPGGFSQPHCGGAGGNGGAAGQTSSGGLGGADSTAAGQGGAGQNDTGGGGSG